MKIIIGAGDTYEEGWISTNEEQVNLLDSASFLSFFGDKKASAMLAEHVWEHLTFEEGKIAALNCYNFINEGGYIRIGVPDGNFRDKNYLKLVGLGGPGPKDHPAFSHKTLYTYKMLVEVFESAGFTVTLLEFCDENGVFHYKYWNPIDGKIGRSLRFDTRNSVDKIGMPSIIIDAQKVLKINTVE